METVSLKALAEKALHRNHMGNILETKSFRAGKTEAKVSVEVSTIESATSITSGDKAQPLLKPCHICHTFSWWLSVHGPLVCGVCHTPATPEIVKRWVGNETESRKNELRLTG